MREFKESCFYIIMLCWKYKDMNFKITVDSFFKHIAIGKGGFGKVYGGENIYSGKMFAIKSIDIVKKPLDNADKYIEMLKKEHDILKKLDSDFVVNLSYSFMWNLKIYLALDLCEGGDLSYHLYIHRTFTLEIIRFYAAEIILGLEYIHSKGIIHLDLKPPNILLDLNGHAKITDFGLAIYEREPIRPYYLGTRGYKAPEVNDRKLKIHYGTSADYFSLGCTLFTFFIGREQYYILYQSDSSSQSEPRIDDIPEEYEEDFKILLKGLLEENPNTRLRITQNNYSIKYSPFFKSINWDKMYSRTETAPIIPCLNEINCSSLDDSIDLMRWRKVKKFHFLKSKLADFEYVNTFRLRKEFFDSMFKTPNFLLKIPNLKKILDFSFFKNKMSQDPNFVYCCLIDEIGMIIPILSSMSILIFRNKLVICNTDLKAKSEIKLDSNLKILYLYGWRGAPYIKICKSEKIIYLCKGITDNETSTLYKYINDCCQRINN